MSAFCQISGLILIAIENFWILPHFILCMSRVVKKVSCELNFWHKSKFLDFAKFHPSQVRSGQNLDCKPNFQCDWKYLDFAIFHPSTRIKISSLAGQGWSNCWFQVKFTKRLKISGLCQILSFAGLEWSKIYFLSQIFNTNQNFSRFCQISSFAGSEWSTLLFFSQICSVTENFWILPNFILYMSRVVKTLNFGLNFDCNWKFLNFTTFHPLHVQSGQKYQLWAKFLTRIKISWFAKFHPSQVRSGPNLDCKPNFQRDWKYLDFVICHPSQVWSGQKSIFWAKFSTQIKIFLDFVKFHPLLVQSGQHSHFLAKFAAWLKISGFCQISSFACPEWSKLSILGLILIAIENFWILPHFILCMSRVVKNVSFELNFWHESKFLDFAKFHPSAGQEWSKSWFQAEFSTRLKISGFCHWFHPSQVWSGQKSHFWAKFSTQIKIFLDFVKFLSLLVCQIPEWAKLSFLSQIFNSDWKFLDCCQISTFACPEWSKLSILGLIFIAIENF